MSLSRLAATVAATASMLVLSVPSFAAAHHKAVRPAKAHPAAKAKQTSKPLAFRCIHCGRPIKLASAAGMKATCAVCGCRQTNANCQPRK